MFDKVDSQTKNTENLRSRNFWLHNDQLTNTIQLNEIVNFSYGHFKPSVAASLAEWFIYCDTDS